jgi:hypothetical protein
MRLLKYIFYGFTLFFVVNVSAQKDNGHPILDKYSVFDAGGKVYISCTISSGNTCNGIDVFRSADSLVFNNIGNIAGICGSTSEPVTYDFVDENPIINKTSYYKLELGGYGYTTILSVLIIDTKEFGFQVRPNPANEKTVIYFDNDNFNDFELTLYNLSGTKVYSSTSSTNYFDINTQNLANGLYFFTIGKSLDQKKIIGKLVVQH